MQRFKAAFLDLHCYILKMRVVQEFINDVYYAFIDEIGPCNVDQDIEIGGYGFQFLFYNGFVEERDVLTEADQVFIIIVYDHNRRAEIAPYQEEQRYSHPYEDPDQQVGEEDGQDRYHEGDQLVPSFPVEFPEQGWFCQFVPGSDQDGSQRTQRDPVQQSRDEKNA